MAVRSVVNVEVNDEEFQRFAKAFDKYKIAVAKTPEEWAKANLSSRGVAANTNNARTNAEKILDAFRKLGSENAKVSRASEIQARSWKDMAKSAQTFATHIVEATRSLMRWAGLTGLIGGILGVGGLFGIERLASFAGNQRATGLALGMKPGDAKAFEANLGARGYDTQSFLGNVNQGLLDLTSPQFLGLRGVLGPGFNPNGKNTADVAEQALEALKKRVDEVPLGPQFEPMVRARRLDQLMSMEDLLRLRNTPAAEVGTYARNIQRDRSAMELPDATAKVWQDLQSQFVRAGTVIEDLIVKKLADLAEPIARLSSAFIKAVDALLSRPEIEDWMKKLADGLDWLATKIGDEKFHEQVGRFIDGVETIATAIWEFVKALTDGIETITSWFGKPSNPNGPADPGDPNEPGISPLERMRREWITHAPPALGGMSNEPRGIRDNNPLNLEYRPGQGAVGSDGRFGIYSSMEEGVAAAERQLVRYQERGLDTIRKIISRWAPPGENNTDAYVAEVSRSSGVLPDTHVDIRDRNSAQAIISAMIKHETGRSLEPETVSRGVVKGLGTEQPPQPPGMKVGLFPPQLPPQIRVSISNGTGADIFIAASQIA